MLKDEGNKCKYKVKITNSLTKELVAFLNTEGGTVYIGVKKNKEVVGVENIDKAMIVLSDMITDQISPRCVHLIHPDTGTIDGKDVIKIDVNKGDRLFYIKRYGLSEMGCYVRVGSTCKSLLPSEIEDRYIRSLSIPEKSIVDMPSKRKNLSFMILKNYLISAGKHIEEANFLDNYHLLTADGEYNYLAEILADSNDIVINVATFASKDKTKYLKREEFGGKCLLLAMDQAKNYINSINQTYVDLSTTPRREKKMFDTEAFEQAWINACVHNKWSESNHPGIYVYSDRLEIESFGGIPKALTKKQFLSGKSEPVNKELFSIFRSCNFAEESGHGVPSVVRAYGEDAYVFSEFFINVILGFDKVGFSGTKGNAAKKSSGKIRDDILGLLSDNGQLSRNDLAFYLDVSPASVRHHLGKLQSEGAIRHCGPDKGGYWEVLKAA